MEKNQKYVVVVVDTTKERINVYNVSERILIEYKEFDGKTETTFKRKSRS